jgi:YHS domain-containing protein
MKRLLLLILLVSSGGAFAQTQYFNTDGVAIHGYDPVSYFTENKPVEGSKQFAYSWMGTEWHFKNQANLDTFKSDPAKYAPQFGGYCAYGLSEDHKSPTESDAFTIVDGKLYLNYNTKVRTLWQKDIPGRIKKAEVNWVNLKDKQ